MIAIFLDVECFHDFNIFFHKNIALLRNNYNFLILTNFLRLNSIKLKKCTPLNFTKYEIMISYDDQVTKEFFLKFDKHENLTRRGYFFTHKPPFYKVSLSTSIFSISSNDLNALQIEKIDK
jgi:hypothetical protein